jgi:roadblock/LC7 domain-containing protein
MLRGRSDQRGRAGGIRAGAFIRASLICGVTVSVLSLSPLAAHASSTLSAGSGQVWAQSSSTAESEAETAAYQNLLRVAQSHGYSTCIDVTYSDSLYYIVPGGGGYVYTSTATGLCGNEVFQQGTTLSAGSGQVWAQSSSTAESEAETAAYQNLLRAAQSHGYSTCIDVTYSDSLYYIVPGGGGYVYTSTATGLCGNEVFH